MQLEVKKYLQDIRVAIDSIIEYIGDHTTLELYQANKLLRRAVERELEIIGEATGKLLKIDPNIDISDARRIVSLRNWVIHAYDSVDDIIIWGIVQKDLPLLQSQVNSLLTQP